MVAFTVFAAPSMAWCQPALAPADEATSIYAGVPNQQALGVDSDGQALVEVQPVVLLGLADGAGVGIVGIKGDYGAQVSIAWLPVVITTNALQPAISRILLVHGYQFSGQVFMLPWRFTRIWRMGLQAGYRWHDQLGHGGTFGLTNAISLGTEMTLWASLAFSFHPSAEDRVRAEQGFSEGTDLNWPLSVGLQGGMGAGLSF
jgi:hypothetical protein